MDGFGAGDKPKKKRTSADRFAWHACWHGDALLGVQHLDDGERGVYVTLIWLMYQHRAALPLDHAWLARQCNIPVQRLRARLASLEGKGRIVVDTEMNLVYDDRVIRELEAAGRYSKDQAARASKRWGPKPAPAKGRPELKVVGNVGPLSEENISALAEISPPLSLGLSPPLSPPKVGGAEKANPLAAKQDHACRGDATQTHTQIHNPTKPAQAPRAAPPGGGRSGQSVEEWRADQLRRMGLTDEGKDGTASVDAPAPKPGADRKAKRA